MFVNFLIIKRDHKRVLEIKIKYRKFTIDISGWQNKIAYVN